MTTLALVVAAAALIAAYLAIRQAGAVDRQLSDISSSLNQLRSALNDAGQKTDSKLAELRLELHRKAGDVLFAPDMTIKEALAVHPRVGEVLADFHLGGCSQCAVSDVDTIEGACQSYGIDQKALMNALNQLVEGSGGSAKPIDVATGRLNI